MGEDEFGSIFLRIRRTQASTLRDKLQVSPDRVQERVPGESLSLMTRHVVEEAELQGSGSDFLAAHRDSHRGRVDEDVAGFTGWRVMGASQYGSDHQPDFSRSQRNAERAQLQRIRLYPLFMASATLRC